MPAEVIARLADRADRPQPPREPMDSRVDLRRFALQLSSGLPRRNIGETAFSKPCAEQAKAHTDAFARWSLARIPEQPALRVETCLRARTRRAQILRWGA